jgi:hypothetical protein
MAEYNGWKNRATWNVSLWLQNDEYLYMEACDFMQRYKGKAPYRQFIRSMGMCYEKTPDRFQWISQKLDYKALNEMMRELVS